MRDQCYSSADIEAAQAIEFQTQLMVASDICAAAAYTQFTQRNREAIASYQKQMIDHFRRGGTKSAERTFDTYMTKLANMDALSSGMQTVAQVCQAASGLLATASSIGSPAEFRAYIANQAMTNRANYSACKIKTPRATAALSEANRGN